MSKEAIPSAEKPSLFLIGSGEEITALLQKTPTRVLHLVPNINGGWKMENEFLGENWKVKEKNGNFYVSTRSQAGGHAVGNTSEPFPIYRHPKYS